MRILACFYVVLISFSLIGMEQDNLLCESENLSTMGSSSKLSKEQLDRYYGKNRRFFIEAIPRNSGLAILLDNGTVWDCLFNEPSVRQAVHQWRAGRRIYMTTVNDHVAVVDLEGSSVGIHSYGSGQGLYADLAAFIDWDTVGSLPTIKSIEGRLVKLSDGSVWKENYWFFSSINSWKVGDVVFVDRLDLINLNHVNRAKFNLFDIEE